MEKKTRAIGKKLALAASTAQVRLDLGCGQTPKEGFEGVDIRGGGAKHVVDLFKFPWPFASDSVDEIHCSHFCEHIPAREIEERDLSTDALSTDVVQGADAAAYRNAERFLGQDMLFAFMDECHRIMKKDAWMTAIVPSGRSSRAFWDPTHRRFFMQETFLYFSAEWRKINGLDHYRAVCNFGVDVGQIIPSDETLRSAEAQQMRFQHYWNTTYDWVAKLKKL